MAKFDNRHHQTILYHRPNQSLLLFCGLGGDLFGVGGCGFGVRGCKLFLRETREYNFSSSFCLLFLTYYTLPPFCVITRPLSRTSCLFPCMIIRAHKCITMHKDARIRHHTSRLGNEALKRLAAA